MPVALPSVAYIVASVLFILSLRGLSTQASARRGNLLGATGMVLAVAVAALALLVGTQSSPAEFAPGSAGLLAAMIAVGCVVGAVLAARVAMTSMPELVAMLHSFVGLAAVLVGIASSMRKTGTEAVLGTDVAHEIEVVIGIFVGAVTFTGSIVAFLKLRGSISGRPLILPARHLLNLTLVVACAVFGTLHVLQGGSVHGVQWLLLIAAVSSVLGVHLVAAIGGGDMPVVVSMLNSYSGWAASAAGFMLSNDLLIITGALVGSSGAILSYIMCKAMNRSFVSVILGGFGGEVAKGAGASVAGTIQETSCQEVGDLLLSAKRVVIVPGYGMAVAQAQHAVRELTDFLRGRGIKVEYAIHPVAGRLPGHMNVLLAEAGVSYEIVKEMDEIQDELPETDVVLVVGANDIVNPSALDDPSSPIWGMPVLQVWKSGRVVMLKRSMSSGYAGVDNPLCYRDNTLMLFGDAKQSVSKLLATVQAAA